ncbi:MAG TPA: hypothetical protein VK525_08075 [Candidatus Saccharimonadales bacterium]|nr:hypothetical protein [Candidatus Saccharimonadales bacterium]
MWFWCNTGPGTGIKREMENARRILKRSAARHSCLAVCGALLCVTPSAAPQDRPPVGTARPGSVVFERVIANQKKTDDALNLYERIERVENRKTGSDPQAAQTKISRVIPAGTGVAHIALGPAGEPTDAVAYRAEIAKLEKSLVWAVERGRAQQEAYEKVAKKRKERDALIEAAGEAFIFTFLGTEERGAHTLLKYGMEPNPKFKPTTRSSAVYTKVRGTVWIDEPSGQLARIEGEVTDDISVGLFLAKVYKGSRFMEECYPMAPGIWLPTYSQYDFDGRKFFVPFSIHERTFFTKYRYIGQPAEALSAIRAELGKSSPSVADR